MVLSKGGREFQRSVLEKSYSSFFWIVLLVRIFLGRSDRWVNQFFIIIIFLNPNWFQPSLELEPKRFETSGLKIVSGFICAKLHCCLVLLANTWGH